MTRRRKRKLKHVSRTEKLAIIAYLEKVLVDHLLKQHQAKVQA